MDPKKTEPHVKENREMQTPPTPPRRDPYGDPDDIIKNAQADVLPPK